jgi:quercetin dioxygenase-like cupin family protein
MKVFSSFNLERPGYVAELDRQFPSHLSVFHEAIKFFQEPTQETHYGFVYRGNATLKTNGFTYSVPERHWFCVVGSFTIVGATGIIMTREGFEGGMFQIGGPLENKGRYRYIDGCSDSLLIPPIIKGDPCLNLLHFPKGIDQTEHTHPSDRIGMIVSGRGECVVNGGEEVIQLEAGMAFCIHTDGPHKFRTLHGSTMNVLAYHPDSDYGPTDQCHPMVNRTIVHGMSASYLPEIQSKDIVE